MAKQAPLSPQAQINLIAEGTEVEGTLKAGDDIRVSGRFKGTLRVDGKAVLAQEGVIEGDVHAQDADIAGSLTGEINVKGRLLLKGTAKVDGTIRTSRLIVEEGASFDGTCEMGRLDKRRAKALSSGNGSTSTAPSGALSSLSDGR